MSKRRMPGGPWVLDGYPAQWNLDRESDQWHNGACGKITMP